MVRSGYAATSSGFLVPRSCAKSTVGSLQVGGVVDPLVVYGVVAVITNEHEMLPRFASETLLDFRAAATPGSTGTVLGWSVGMCEETEHRQMHNDEGYGHRDEAVAHGNG